jgi:hypothetical protein
MKRTPLISTLSVCSLAGFCFLACIATSIRAQGVNVQGRVLLPFKNPEGIEASAVEPIGDGTYLLVANDKKSELLIVKAATGEITKPYLPIPGLQCSYCDWEGMAKDSDNNYYLIGSQSDLVRFRLNDEHEKNPLKIVIEPDTSILDIKKSFDSVKRNELKGHSAELEGLAVRENSGVKELVVGVRQFDSETVYIYRVELTGNNELVLLPFFRLNFSKTEKVNWHLSSIEHIPDWHGFIIVLSTEKESPKSKVFYGNLLWFVSDKKASELQKNPTDIIERIIPKPAQIFDQGMKAEGLAVICSTKANLKVVITFDNDRNDEAKLAFVELSKPIE